MNWGYKILTVVIVFVTGISAMVYVAMQQSNEMIDNDYYVKELRYQGQIDAQKRLLALPDRLQIDDTLNALHIKLPAGAQSGITEGQISFIRSSDQSKDVDVAFGDAADGIVVSKERLLMGPYKFRISWKSNGVAYYNEQNLNIN